MPKASPGTTATSASSRISAASSTEVCGRLPRISLPSRRLHRRVRVEGALGLRADHAVDLVEHPHDRLAAAVEGRRASRRPRPGRRRRRRARRPARRCETLEVACDWRLVAALTTSFGPMIQPTRQPVIAYVLATPLTTMHLSRSSGTTRGQRGELRVAVDQVLVDLVGQHPQAVLDGPAADRLDVARAVDRAGRVGRGDEEHDLRPLRAGRLQLLDGDAVAGGLVGDDLDRDTAGEPDRLGVGRPVRRRDDDLVARVEDRGEGLVDGLLAAVGDQDLGGVDLVAGVAQRLGGDRGLQLGQAAGRRVAVVLRVAAGLDRGLDDVVRASGSPARRRRSRSPDARRP